MKSIPDFLEYISKHLLKKKYSFKSNFNTNGIRSFFLFKKDKKIKFTNKFDGTCLEDCQHTIFETNDLYITPIKIVSNIIGNIDSKYLSEEGLKIRKIIKNNNF